MRKILLLNVAMLFVCLAAMGQAKKPTLMVFPSNVWCSNHGCMTTFNNQGVTEYVPDYNKALNTDADLSAVISKIGGLMSERGFPLKDLGQTMRSLNTTSALNSVSVSKSSGAKIQESPLDRLMRVAKCDIRMEVEWTISQVGPKKQVRYVLKGLDAWTNTQVAEASGVGPQSFSADVPVLLEEAVLDKMDGFCSQLQAHFDDMLENGRAILIDIQVFDGAGVDLETEYNGTELNDIIDEWFNDNTVSHRYNRVDNTESMAKFDDVRMPLFDVNNKAMDARQFANKLVKVLKSPPYKIPVKIFNRGQGYVMLALGEK